MAANMGSPFHLCRFFSLLLLLLVFPLHNLHVDARYGLMTPKSVVDLICNQTQDPVFCERKLGGDPRTPAADMNGLAKITISATIIELQATISEFPGISGKISDPVGKQRISFCESNYNDAINIFQNAFSLSDARSYTEVLFKVRDGTNKVIDCEDVYRKDPISPSPLTTENANVFKLSEIILIIVDSLVPH